jgi:hypothetical protein
LNPQRDTNSIICRLSRCPRFCGGTEPTSCWLAKEGLLQFVKSLGFEVQIGEDNPHHPNGPSILLFARRT